MPEICDGKDIKTIAFYLPQFHEIPENNAAWGKGFTEWTNVRKAQPLFEGHYQPRIPYEGKYYDLLEPGVLAEQAETAKKYGVYGFCYYHYWFKDGKKLLEKPLETMLQDKAVDMPFCLSWANENWTRKWDGGDREIIVAQDYGNQKEWEQHFLYLLDFFKDKRYITVEGKPLLVIYRPAEIPCIQEMLKFWQRRSREEGLKGLCFAVQNGSAYFDPGFDMGLFSWQIKFEPFFSHDLSKRPDWNRKKKVFRILKKLHLLNIALGIRKKMKKCEIKSENAVQTVMEYDVIWKTILQRNPDAFLLEGACVDWDNTPRTSTGYRMNGAEPDKFGKYMSQLCDKINTEKGMPVIFINAWNEWGEGAYLEPDERYGYRYLENLQQALQKTQRDTVNSV